jgi:hypothetical protein
LAGVGFPHQQHWGRGRQDTSGLFLLDHHHRDRVRHVGHIYPRGAKEHQLIGLPQPDFAAGEHLQPLPVLGFAVLELKPAKVFLARQMVIA